MRLSQLLFTILIFTFAVFGANAGQDFHHHGESKLPKINYDSLFEAAAPLEQSADGQALLDKCIQAYGGRDHLEKLTSLRTVWQMKALMARDSIRVERTFGEDRQYRISKTVDDWTEERVMNGQKAWYQTNDTLVELPSDRYKSELFSNLVMRLPMSIESEIYSERRFGRRTDDSLEYLYLTKNDSLVVIVGIDPNNGMIKSAEGIIKNDDRDVVFINYFADHQTHQGYIFPSSLTNIAMGLTVGESVLSKVEVNPKLGDTVFEPRQREVGADSH
jgi:hypothetical protein